MRYLCVICRSDISAIGPAQRASRVGSGRHDRVVATVASRSGDRRAGRAPLWLRRLPFRAWACPARRAHSHCHPQGPAPHRADVDEGAGTAGNGPRSNETGGGLRPSKSLPAVSSSGARFAALPVARSAAAHRSWRSRRRTRVPRSRPSRAGFQPGALIGSSGREWSTRGRTSCQGSKNPWWTSTALSFPNRRVSPTSVRSAFDSRAQGSCRRGRRSALRAAPPASCQSSTLGWTFRRGGSRSRSRCRNRTSLTRAP